MEMFRCLFVLLLLPPTPCISYQPDRDHYRQDKGEDGLGILGSSKVARNVEKRLIVTTVLEPPYMMLKVDGAFLMGNDRFEGYLADMVAALAKGVGFDYQIRLTSDGTIGHINSENGNWTGMIGDLIQKEADIAAGPLVISSPREEVVDFSVPYMTFRSSALIRKPKRKKRVRIKTAPDLLKSHIPYGVIQSSITQSQFMSSWNTTYRSMWAKMATTWPSTFVQSTQEGVERARREKYAFILDSPAAEYITGRKPCDLYTIEPFLNLKHYAFAVRKASRLKQLVNSQLQLMQANQELQSIYLKWWNSECIPPKEPTMRPRDLRTPDYFGRGDTTTTEPYPWRYATAAGYSDKAASSSFYLCNSLLCILSLCIVLYNKLYISSI